MTLRIAVAFAAVLSVATAAGGQSAVEKPFDESITLRELFDKGRDAAGMGNTAVAEQFYQEILLREPSNLDAMLELATAYERAGRLEYARGLLLRAQTLRPTDADLGARIRTVNGRLAESLNEEIASLMGRRDYEAAIPRLGLYLDIFPGNGPLLYRRAICLRAVGRIAAAIADLDRALQVNPDPQYEALRREIAEVAKRNSVENLRDRARALIATGAPAAIDSAIDAVAGIIELSPDDEWARAEFIRLSGGTQPRIRDESSGLRDAADTAEKNAVSALRQAADFIDRHIAMLVALFIVVAVFRSPLTRALVRKTSRQPLLSGQLARFSLPEILLLLNAEPHTGLLRVKGRTCSGKIFFQEGEPCHAVVGKLEGKDAILHLIDETDEGVFAFDTSGISIECTIDTPLSLILVEHAQESSSSPPKPPVERPKSRMKELLESRTS